MPSYSMYTHGMNTRGDRWLKWLLWQLFGLNMLNSSNLGKMCYWLCEFDVCFVAERVAVTVVYRSSVNYRIMYLEYSATNVSAYMQIKMWHQCKDPTAIIHRSTFKMSLRICMNCQYNVQSVFVSGISGLSSDIGNILSKYDYLHYGSRK